MNLVTPRIKSSAKRGYTKVAINLWRVTVHWREGNRDLCFLYADEAKAKAVADRIVTSRKRMINQCVDVEQVDFTTRTYNEQTEFKMVWWKKEKGGFYCLKDYVYVGPYHEEKVIIE